MLPFFHNRRVNVRSGFSLVEMLVVVAIMGILAALSTPAISSLMSSGNVNQAVSGISLLLEQSRAYAMSHNTYVWVGFTQEPGASSTLAVGVVAGTTGEASDLGSNRYAPISKVQSYSNFNVTSVATVVAANSGSSWTTTLPGGTDLTNPTPPPSLALSSFKQTVNGVSTSFNGSIMQFNPQGEVSLSAVSTDPPLHWVQFGLQPSRAGKANVAVIQVAGLSGQVQVFRP